MLSSFTLISVIGVVLGVMVMVVVLAGYAGIERTIKDRILGFTPHVLVQYSPDVFAEEGFADWQELAAKVETLPRVEKASAYVSDNVILDVESWQRPVLFRGIDTDDPEQVNGIKQMLDLKGYPESSADLGIDDRAIISSTVAEQYGIGIGSVVRLYSTRNFEEVMRAYKSTERPAMREAYADQWQKAVSALKSGWVCNEQGTAIEIKTLFKAYEPLNLLLSEPIRDAEKELLETLLIAMEEGKKDEDNGVYQFKKEDKAAIDNAIDALNTTDIEKMDGNELKNLKSIVLPKEVTIIGVYQTSQFAITPDLFVPLPLAQDLAGLDGSVQGIALRLDDAYQAERVASAARESYGPSYYFLTWGDQYQAFFALISQQRMMLGIVLSTIILVSAFSMMAVIFTVTIQKRREIGVMKALGAAPGQIVRVFLYQGMILGIAGAALGIGSGRLFIHFRGVVQSALRALGFDPFSAALTGSDIIPAYNNTLHQWLIGIGAFILCSLAALVPAFFAARSDAAKSLRNV